jgi:hypothetical protein
MEIVVKRVAKRITYTIGKLYVNGTYVCDTLEDTDRGLTSLLNDEEVRKKKVHGKTAIPSGYYQVALNLVSPRFKNKEPYKSLCNGNVPRILNVKGFDGVLIHCGNTAADTEGCILVGYNKAVGKVLNSRDAFTKLYNNYLKKALGAKEKVTIKIQ